MDTKHLQQLDKWLKEVTIEGYVFKFVNGYMGLAVRYWVTDIKTKNQIELGTSICFDPNIRYSRIEFFTEVYVLYLYTILHETAELFKVKNKSFFHPHENNGKAFAEIVRPLAAKAAEQVCIVYDAVKI